MADDTAVVGADIPLISLTDKGFGAAKVKVSSVLNRDVKQFGKNFMFDGEEETCWNSDQGIPQHVTVELPAAAVAKRIELKFQGGFTGRECVLLSGDSGEKLQEVQKFYPEDINSNQVPKQMLQSCLFKQFGFLWSDNYLSFPDVWWYR